MHIQEDSQSLFLVVLGGKAPNSHIELHDVRWVIGSSIKETFGQLRSEWFGDNKGLHIDSYMKICYIDGYQVKVNPCMDEFHKLDNIQAKTSNLSLWFVNLGGYNPNDMNEHHSFGLLVAKTYAEAKKIAKERWLTLTDKKHVDNIHCISFLYKENNLFDYNKIGKWQIQLFQDTQQRSQDLIPDWVGYMRIDNN